MRDIKLLTELCERLIEYQKDPHPGLLSWVQCVAETTEQIAEEACRVTFNDPDLSVEELKQKLYSQSLPSGS